MRRLSVICLLLALCWTGFSQVSDIDLILDRDFNSLKLDETLPDSLSKFEKTAALIGRQLTGDCYFSPECYTFARQAVEKHDVFHGILITSDRLTRCGRIGTVKALTRAEEDGKIHEGIEAYDIKKKMPVPEFKKTDVKIELPSHGKDYASKDFEFVNYLIENDFQKDAATLVSNGSYILSDTLYYLKGWTDYNVKSLETASAAFDLVGRESPFYDKSLFYNVVCCLHSGDISKASNLLDSYNGPRAELKALQSAGIALINNDLESYRKASSIFKYEDMALSQSEEALQNLYNSISATKKKNPYIAAAASAVIPGLGKIYAGQIGEGIASFFAVGSLGAITAENWVKKGFWNWKTILFGTVGTVVYLGNIYGSYVSVSIENDVIKETQNTTILYHVHIPLRSVFK